MRVPKGGPSFVGWGDTFEECLRDLDMRKRLLVTRDGVTPPSGGYYGDWRPSDTIREGLGLPLFPDERPERPAPRPLTEGESSVVRQYVTNVSDRKA